MKDPDYETRTIVLKKQIDEDQTVEIIEDKKTGLFRTLLKKPKKDEVHLHSLKLNLEAILMVSGYYSADYFRKATHTIKVDYNVKEVVLGDGVFPVRTKSGFQKALTGKRGKNSIDLELEEHVFIEEEDTIYFNHHGQEVSFSYKINSKNIENYPKKVLGQNKSNIKKPEITYEASIDKLALKLKRPLESDVEALNEKLTIQEISEIYVPIYEARLIGPKKKVGLLRIDAARKKII